MCRIPERFKIECGINANSTDMKEIKKLIDKYEAVVICDIDKNKQKEILSYCYTNQKRVYLLPDITDIAINNAYEIQIGDTLTSPLAIRLSSRYITRLVNTTASEKLYIVS